MMNSRTLTLFFPLVLAFFSAIVSSVESSIGDTPYSLTEVGQTPSEEPGIQLFNLTFPLQDPDCYSSSDDTFFSLLAPKNFNTQTCAVEASNFKNHLLTISQGLIRLKWSPDPREGGPLQTSRKDINIIESEFQLPLYHKADNCSIAIVTEALLSDFSKQAGIEWRQEWGAREQKQLNVNKVDILVRQLIRGLEGALKCPGKKTGAQAGHQSLMDDLLHVFVWPGDYTTFGQVFSVPGGTGL